MRIQSGPAIFSRDVSRSGLRLVELPRNADGFGLAYRGTQALQLIACQESFAAVFPKFSNAARWIVSPGNQTAYRGVSKQRADALNRPIGSDRCNVTDARMQPGNIGVREVASSLIEPTVGIACLRR